VPQSPPSSAPRAIPAGRSRFVSPLAWFRRAGAGEYPLGYHASLDGARGLMTIGVMVAHIHYSFYPGSIIFMDTFFMMSAYLITALLLKDWVKYGTLRFWNFYTRRFLRLFPALAVLCLVFGIVVLLFLDNKRAHAFEIASAFFYFSNWTRAFGVEVPGYLGHTWSLSIEEQFYAIWPWLLLLLLRRFGVGNRVALILAAGAVLVSLWRFWLASHGAPVYRMYNGFDTRADALLLGCMLAFVLHPKESVARTLLARHARWMVPVVSVVMFILGLRMNYEDIQYYRYWESICLVLSVLFCAGLIASSDTIAHRFFEAPVLVYLGKICYGLYLWHVPVFLLMRLDLKLSEPWEWTIGVALTLTLASLSHFFVEQKALALRHKFG
jgi:peptidoglycan/LPS O-acetylase OafA/YrhL